MEDVKSENHCALPVRIYLFSTWADKIEDAEIYLANLPQRDIRKLVIRPNDEDLVRLGRLNCDWEGENLRAFAAMQHPDLRFLPARMLGTEGLSQLAKEDAPQGEDGWVFFIAQHPQIHERVIGRLLHHITQRGYRIFYWAFDEASRNMPCFKSGVAPYISILAHDETPLDPDGAAVLRKDCLMHETSWVANMVPFAYPFQSEVEKKIVFLGSQKGLTAHRRRQIDFLQKRYGDQFQAFHDHSVSISQREIFGRYQVHFCPEGGHFTTHGMRKSHTDRPFWAGCLGQVPVVENSQWGERMQGESENGMIERYDHSDLDSLGEACDRALAVSGEKRKTIYDYFNRCGTIGPIAADLLAEYCKQQSF